MSGFDRLRDEFGIPSRELLKYIPAGHENWIWRTDAGRSIRQLGEVATYSGVSLEDIADDFAKLPHDITWNRRVVGNFPTIEDKPEEDEMSDQDDRREYYVIPADAVYNYNEWTDHGQPQTSLQLCGERLKYKRKLPVTNFSEGGFEKLEEVSERVKYLNDRVIKEASMTRHRLDVLFDKPKPNTTLEIKDGHLENMARKVVELLGENNHRFDCVKISEETLLNFRAELKTWFSEKLEENAQFIHDSHRSTWGLMQELEGRIHEKLDLEPECEWTQPIREILGNVNLPPLKGYIGKLQLRGTDFAPEWHVKEGDGVVIDLPPDELANSAGIMVQVDQLKPLLKRLALLEKAHGEQLDAQTAAKASKPGIVTRAKGALGKIALVASGAGLMALGGMV